MAIPKLRVGPGVEAGVDDALIRAQVHTFYARVRRHEVLGPIFENAIDDWDEHLAKLCDFWSSVLLMTGRFKGSPMAAHARRPDIEESHFPMWLELFEATARDVCPPAAAELFIARSRQIGQSLSLGVAYSRGVLPTAP